MQKNLKSTQNLKTRTRFQIVDGQAIGLEFGHVYPPKSGCSPIENALPLKIKSKVNGEPLTFVCIYFQAERP